MRRKLSRISSPGGAADASEVDEVLEEVSDEVRDEVRDNDRPGGGSILQAEACHCDYGAK